MYNCTASVYINLSGLVTVRASDFKINSYNSTFARLLLGYSATQLIEKPVTSLISNFFDPDLTSTASRPPSALSKPSTPLRLNTSYLNGGGGGSSSAQRHGSSARHQHNNWSSSSRRSRPEALQLMKSLPMVPKFVITEPLSVERNRAAAATAAMASAHNDLDVTSNSANSMYPSANVCTNCNALIQVTELKNLAGTTGDELYSPNRKCVNYLDSNIFPTTCDQVGVLAPAQQPKTSSSLPTTPQSTQMKRSLLARAIKNNMAQLSINLFNNNTNPSVTNPALNRSIDDVSMLSNNCPSSTAAAAADISISSSAGDTDIEVLNESNLSDVSSSSCDMMTTPESSPQRQQRMPGSSDSKAVLTDDSICDSSQSNISFMLYYNFLF